MTTEAQGGKVTGIDIADRLSPGQKAALEKIQNWYTTSDEQVFRLFGPAGTGKTTIARLVPQLLDLEDGQYFFGAFSGKAVNVLRLKGCLPAHTLHRLMYGAPINLRAELRQAERILDDLLENGPEKGVDDEATANLREEHEEAVRNTRERIHSLELKIRAEGALKFDRNLESPLNDASLVIADEVSMVGDRMASDLLSFGCKVLVLGDPFQLAPVRGEGTLTMAVPDVMLTEVHRQALDSPVLALATDIRNGVCRDPRAVAPRRRPWWEYDQILTWRRRTRWDAVRALRERYGRPPGVPVEGDRVMCLANNTELQIFNGQTWTVVGTSSENCYDDEIVLHLIDESDDPSDPANVYTIKSYRAAFVEENEKVAEQKGLGRGDDTTMLATFAQALTVHKAQGSEWGSVMVMDESRSIFEMEKGRRGSFEAMSLANRWLYTAVTRAANEVAVVAPRGERR